MTKTHHHYGNAKIYIIRCGEYYYYGSTVMSLSERFQLHKSAAETIPDRPLYAKCKEVGWDIVTIDLVERYPCEDSCSLRIREQEYVGGARQDPLCLNRCDAYLTPEAAIVKKRERQRLRRANLTPDEKERLRLRHNERQRARRAATKK